MPPPSSWKLHAGVRSTQSLSRRSSRRKLGGYPPLARDYRDCLPVFPQCGARFIGACRFGFPLESKTTSSKLNFRGRQNSYENSKQSQIGDVEARSTQIPLKDVKSELGSRLAYKDEDQLEYEMTTVGRSRLDYIWI